MPSVISGDANVSATEFGFLDGVTSGLQSQINAKANDSAVGLVKIVDQSFTSASAVNINNCFTSTYQNYRVLFESVGTAAVALLLRLRASGSDNSTTNYTHQRLVGSSTTATAETSTGLTYLEIGSGITTRGIHAYDFFFPQVATQTQVIGHWMNFLSSGPYIAINAGAHNVATSFDGFSLIPASGNITGTVRVYGYRN